MIDGILALGHFCESHGPCVILCTQRYEEEPQQAPHSLTVPVCEACQSIDLQQSLVSREAKGCYVTTRTPILQDLAFLLKQAVVRSLSCEEETSKDGSTMYFGDSERGHVLSHTFTLQDSLARGFHRKYCILILMREKVNLLNAWPMLTKFIKEVACELQRHANTVNGNEQEKQSQRALRQAQVSPSASARSLSQLTGQPAIFAHIHLWFCWMLNSKIAVMKPNTSPCIYQTIKPHALLRALCQDMGKDVFSIAVYSCLTGIYMESESMVVANFKMLLPHDWPAVSSKGKCILYKDIDWKVLWDGVLPNKLPTLHTLCIKAINDSRLPDEALEPHIQALITQWQNITRSLSYCPTLGKPLLQSLGIQNCDLPLLTYWILHCTESKENPQSIINSLNKILC